MKTECQRCFDVLEAYTRIGHSERFRTWYDECGFKDQNTLCLPFIRLMSMPESDSLQPHDPQSPQCSSSENQTKE